MKRFMVYKIAIISIFFTLSVDVVSMDMTLEEAWKVVNEDCKLNIPKSATFEEVDSAYQSFFDDKNRLELRAFEKSRLNDAIMTIKDNIKVNNAYKWLKENKQKIQEAAREKIKNNANISNWDIRYNILHIFPLLNDNNYNHKIIDVEATKIVADVIEEMKKLQPLHSKPVRVDPAGSEPKMPTSSQSQSAKPNAHQLRRVTLPGALDSATTVLVEQWLNDNNDNLENLITDYFENKKSQGHTVARIKSGDVLDDVIDNLKKDSESYQKLEDSDKIVLHNRIKALLIPDIQKRFNQENELRPRQQLFDFNPNDSNMVTAALELASMLNR